MGRLYFGKYFKKRFVDLNIPVTSRSKKSSIRISDEAFEKGIIQLIAVVLLGLLRLDLHIFLVFEPNLQISHRL